MKINLEKLKKIEEEYKNNPISSCALKNMINIILSNQGDSFSKAYILANKTLINLNIIEIEKEQLNTIGEITNITNQTPPHIQLLKS